MRLNDFAGSAVNSNWASLKAVIGSRKKHAAATKGIAPKEALEAKRPEPLGVDKEPSKVVAVDCEMVGVGPGGLRSSLARLSILRKLHEDPASVNLNALALD